MSDQNQPRSAFDRFLMVAKDKPFPQKLLLVFAKKELRPETEFTGNASDVAEDFSIKPIMYTDKSLGELPDFMHLLQDSLENGEPWDLLFVSALDASRYESEEIARRLEVMVKLIYQGESERFLIFNAMGELTSLAKV